MVRLAFVQSLFVKNVDCTVVKTIFMNHSMGEDLLVALHFTFSLNFFI